MSENSDSLAWLEKADGSRVPILGNCSLGRTPSNQIVLADERVSRRHATIHAQGDGEFWLVDLGSSNGTSVNGRRVSQPSRLRHGDTIQIGAFELVFRETSGRTRDPSALTVAADPTLVAVTRASCWLLLADIENSSSLSQSLDPEALAVVIGHWFAQCKEAIEAQGGAINKYLGDGLFAYWSATQLTPPQLVAALAALRQLQEKGEPTFRLVLHHGPVVMGGMVSKGEESLSGMDVNFVFRMEKLAAKLRQPRLLSDAAAQQLGGSLVTTPVGRHSLPGFDGEHSFLSF